MKILSYIRRIFTWTLLLCVAVFSLSYIVLSTNGIQNYIGGYTEEKLSELFDTKVKIEKIKVSPIDKVSIDDIVIYDQKNEIMKTPLSYLYSSSKSTLHTLFLRDAGNPLYHIVCRF